MYTSMLEYIEAYTVSIVIGSYIDIVYWLDM